jgi:hypothetical protein
MGEERLRATAGLRGPINLSSWRGRSGRRYVVGVHPLTEPELLDVADAVIVAVRRGRDGPAQVIDVAAIGGRWRERTRRCWVSLAREHGANEMHVHRLAESADERAAIAEDLREGRTERVRPALWMSARE